MEKILLNLVLVAVFLKYQGPSSNSVSRQGITRIEYVAKFEMLRMCHVAQSLNFWNVYVRVPWNTLVERTS